MTSFRDLQLQAEQLTTRMDVTADLPRVSRDIAQISDITERLTRKTQRATVANNAGHYLLATQGYDADRATRSLDAINLKATFEPLEPLADTDVQGFLKHEHELMMLTAVEDAKNTTLSDFDNAHTRAMDSEWERAKRAILDRFDRRPIVGCVDSAALMMNSSTSGTTFLHEQQLQHQNVNNGNNRTEGYQSRGRSGLDSRTALYAHVVYKLNEARLLRQAFPLLSELVKVCDELDSMAIAEQQQTSLPSSAVPTLQGKSGTNAALRRCWKLLARIVEEDALVASGETGERVYEQQYSDSNRLPILQEKFVQATRCFLEDEYFVRVQEEVRAKPAQARLGGRPGALSLIRSYLNILFPTGWPAVLEDIVDGVPLWPCLYYLMRCGQWDDVLKLASSSSAFTDGLDTFLSEYVNNGQSLSAQSAEALRAIYTRKVKRSSHDVYKALCFVLVGRLDTQAFFPAIITTTQDYMWLRLANISVDYPLSELQFLVAETHGDSYFDPDKLHPLRYVEVLLLSAQFERAVGYLATEAPNLLCEAVHMAVALSHFGLLHCSVVNVPELLSRDSHSPSHNWMVLNFSRLIMQYASGFSRTDPREAMEYYFLLAELDNGQGRSLFVSCLQALILETGEIDMILGSLQHDGSRRAGLVDSFIKTPEDMRGIIELCATDAEARGRIHDAVKLFDLASEHKRVLVLLNSCLGQVVARHSGSRGAGDDTRAQTLALAHAVEHRYELLNILRESELGGEAATFRLLLRLADFMDYHYAERYRESLDLLDKLMILPNGGASAVAQGPGDSDVYDKVRNVRHLGGNVVRNLPAIILATMTSVFKLYEQARTLVSRTHPTDTGHAALLDEMRARSRCLVTFTGLVQQILPGSVDLHSQLLRMDERIA